VASKAHALPQVGAWCTVQRNGGGGGGGFLPGALYLTDIPALMCECSIIPCLNRCVGKGVGRSPKVVTQ
jgi:hypothetical protein